MAIGEQQQADHGDYGQGASQAIDAVDHVVGVAEPGDGHSGKGDGDQS